MHPGSARYCLGNIRESCCFTSVLSFLHRQKSGHNSMPQNTGCHTGTPPSRQGKSDELVTLNLVLSWGLSGCSSPGLLCAEITFVPHPTMLSSLLVFPSVLVGYSGKQEWVSKGVCSLTA